MTNRIRPMRALKAAGAAVCVLAACAQPLEWVVDMGAFARLSVMFAGIVAGAQSAFAANPAADGQSVGSGLIGNALGAMQAPSNQTFVGGLNTTNGSAQMSSAQTPYNDYLDPATNGAIPNFGPAPRPLPQLPLRVDARGFLVARAGYDQPIGPGFWERTTK